MRDYKHIDKYLDKLIEDIYPQPQDPGHTAWAQEAIDAFCSRMTGVKDVLDVGCGEAFCQEIFESKGMNYCGICLGQDYEVAREKGRNVFREDFSFIDFFDDTYDLVFSRHSLEHSPMPILTLMEWHRVTKKYVAIVLPSPEFWQHGGQNHYYVLNDPQWVNLFEKSGFEVEWSYSKQQNMTTDIHRPEVEIEYWYLLRKK